MVFTNRFSDTKNIRNNNDSPIKCKEPSCKTQSDSPRCSEREHRALVRDDDDRYLVTYMETGTLKIQVEKKETGKGKQKAVRVKAK